MEKLLHERLREYDEESEACIFESGSCCIVDLTENEANALADEIERYYIPRPRFEDGEPVQFGDEVKGCNGGLKALLLFKDGSGQAYGSKDDPWEPICGIDFVHDDLKRPTPKVYDADGVEIKVGQKRWSVDSDNEYDILEIKSDGSLVKCGCPNNNELYVWLAPSQLTHEKPVFDAEGVRICKGDKVWDKDAKNPIPMKVLNFVCGEVRTDALGENSPGFMPENLTHREPDSLSKVQQFAVDHAAYADGSERDAFMEIADRLTALIERGA